ncbi:MAG TPA: VacJ family lipoprotein [Stellaceae bacterium]|nr:VacJ family lipoprotein [Stellaceae bacterium]
MSHSTARRRGAARGTLAAGLLLLSGLAGCATPPTDPAARAAFEQTNDPLEPLNRKIFAVNQIIDTILLKPLAEIYVTVFPQIGRDTLRHMLDNLKEPVVAINDTLQFEPKRTGVTVGRFIVNSTVGIGGVLDVASGWGLKKQTGDFGQTLYVWGATSSPYLVLPILGPSNPRDAIGMGIDAYIDPFAYFATVQDADELEIARFVLDGVDQRAQVLDQLDQLQKNSLDFYAQLRSLVQQKRAAELRRGAAPPTPENFYNVPNKAAPPTPGSTRS